MGVHMFDTALLRKSEISMIDEATRTTNQQRSKGKTALIDSLRTHFSGDAPVLEKAKSFAKARPWTSAAFVGVAAIALLNTLRSRA
jgi:hypothetical protein